MESKQSQSVPWARYKKRELTDDEREAIYQRLLDRASNGVLPRGHKSEVARQFAVHASTVNNIWERANETTGSSTTASVPNVRSRKAARRRCTVYDPKSFAALIATLPPEKRNSLRELSRSTGASLTTVRKMWQLGAIDPRYLSRRTNSARTGEPTESERPDWVTDDSVVRPCEARSLRAFHDSALSDVGPRFVPQDKSYLSRSPSGHASDLARSFATWPRPDESRQLCNETQDEQIRELHARIGHLKEWKQAQDQQSSNDGNVGFKGTFED